MPYLLKGLVLSLCLLGPGLSAYADPNSILMEACNAMQDPAKRLECFKAASGQTSTTKSHEPVVRAFVGLQGSLNTGLSYIAYQAAVNEIARELAIYANGPGTSKEAVSKLQQALDAYSDAGTFWSASIRFYADRNNGIAYAGGLPMRMVGLEWMIAKHNLPTRNSDMWGLNVGVPTEAGRTTILAKARADADDGLALLNPTGARTASKEAIDACRRDLLDSSMSSTIKDVLTTHCDGLVEAYKTKYGQSPD